MNEGQQTIYSYRGHVKNGIYGLPSLVLDEWAQGKDSRAHLQLTHRQGPSILQGN